MNKLNRSSYGKLFATALALTAMPACSDDGVSAELKLYDRSTHELGLIGTHLELNGTYGTLCTSPASGSWRVDGPTPFTDSPNALLSVVKDNTACALTLMSIRTGMSATGGITYQPASGILLGTSYKALALPFKVNGAGAEMFYANAHLDFGVLTAFNAAFAIGVVYSDDSTAASGTKTAGYQSFSASVNGAGNIPAPNYDSPVDTTGIIILVNNANIEQSVTGNVVLTLPGTNPQAGESYVVTNDSTPFSGTPTYAEVNDAYNAQALLLTPWTFTSATVVESSRLLLSGVDLTADKVRRIIIAHTDTGTASYQVVTITFSKP